MGRNKKGRCVKKNKHLNIEEHDEIVRAPHSFIIHRGLPGEHIVELTKDFRKVMEPFTAISLKERKKNTIKDFASVAGSLHVSHMCIFSRTEIGMYLKLCKLPRGPTLTFKIIKFSLARDVISTLKKQMVFDEIFKNSPLIVLNNFTGEGMQMKLMVSMLQNMFPTINLTSVNLNTIRRCVCYNYNAATKSIDFRHYAIKVVPMGISKVVKKLVQARVPNLSNCDNYCEFMLKNSIHSESDGGEEMGNDESNVVILPQELSSRGNHEKGCNSAIKLCELGPRLSLQLMKIEDGLLDGDVLFHELINKSESEKLAIQQVREEKKKLKNMRKNLQTKNQGIKEKRKEESKIKSMEGNGMSKEKKKKNQSVLEKSSKCFYEDNRQVVVDNDDDAQYYRDEVGEEPDKELFPQKPRKRKQKLLEYKDGQSRSKKMKFIK